MPLSLFTVGSILLDNSERADDRDRGLRRSPGARQRRADVLATLRDESSFFTAHPELFKPVAVAWRIRREREETR